MKKHLQNVTRAHPCAVVMGWRVGSLHLDRQSLENSIGEPSREYGQEEVTDIFGNKSFDSPKVSVTWVFKSPRGYFEIRDYWWNPKGVWSIAAASDKAALWARSFARSLGKANGSTRARGQQ